MHDAIYLHLLMPGMESFKGFGFMDELCVGPTVVTVMILSAGSFWYPDTVTKQIPMSIIARLEEPEATIYTGL